MSSVVSAVKARTASGTYRVSFIASMKPLTKTSWARALISCCTAGGRPAGSLAPFWPVPIWNPLLDTELNAATNWARKLSGSAPAWLTAWSCNVVARWFCNKAPTTALPMAAPSWRVVLRIPDAAPDICGEMLRMATVVIGAKVMPMPTPATIAGARKLIQVEAGPATYVSQTKPTVNSEMPVVRMYLAPTLSAYRPANGAVNMDVRDIGARVSPAVSAEKPRTDCR